MVSHPFVSGSSQGFSITPPHGISVRPECLKANGVKLIVLDPGHDDSPASMRSDAKVRGGNGKYVFLWPEVHEGKLNMATAWMVYDMLMKDPGLTPNERTELQTMIRFTRHPGETTFAQYEKTAGYASATQGTIDDTVTHRRERANLMMQKHRAFDASKTHGWSASTQDVSSQTVFLSVHANSSDYYNEGDHTWLIPPKGTQTHSKTFAMIKDLVDGFSRELSDYTTVLAGDSSDVANLKREVASTVQADRIKTSEHALNLAMLSSTLGNSSTRKSLLEGFVMNGMAGNLANREVTASNPKLLIFKRGGSEVARYKIAELYVAYAKSIAKGLSDAVGCQAK